jgi:NADH-quinone oxidoreductase subunit G
MTSSAPTQPVATVETIALKVDGRSVTVPRTMADPVTGRPLPTTMIQACEAAGVAVPHYCYHPKLPVAGNCRMCLVEFGLPALGPDRQPILNADGTPKIVVQTLPYDPATPRGAIACATPISSGMEIYTNTPGVRKMREAVLESLLINHPLDCPICDQAGECKLQEYAVDHGPAGSRFVETKVHKPKRVDLGPRILLDDERCILCSRCIRFTRDIVGDDALGIVDRGSYSTLTRFPGRPFDNNYTLNTVDLCPVGALTSKDFRFQMRVWFLKETKSLCTSCATGCNIVIGSRGNHVYRYTPRQNDAVNDCWMCDAGRLNYKWIGRPDRLTAVQIRNPAGTQEPGRWGSVIAEIATRLRLAPKGSVAIVASARQTNEELHLLRELADFCSALTDSVPRSGEADPLLVDADKNPNSAGSRLLGIAAPEMGTQLPRIAEGIRQGQIRTLLVIGEDVTQHGVAPGLLADLETLVVSDILPNATTALARYLLPGCAHAEKRGTFINAEGRLQRFVKAIEPPGDARPESEFLAELLGALTGTALPDNPVGLFNRMAGRVPALKDLSWAGLGDAGVALRLSSDEAGRRG